jgi:hypothetical protein
MKLLMRTVRIVLFAPAAPQQSWEGGFDLFANAGSDFTIAI